LQFNKLENLEEMDKFIWPTKTEPRGYKQNIYNKQCDWSSNKESPNKEKPRTGWIHWWTLQAFKELTPMLLKLFHKIEKRDSSTPPACTEHLHFTLNRETRMAPAPPPDASAQTAWEDTDHKVS
jgi:hypothetical protein